MYVQEMFLKIKMQRGVTTHPFACFGESMIHKLRCCTTVFCLFCCHHVMERRESTKGWSPLELKSVQIVFGARLVEQKDSKTWQTDRMRGWHLRQNTRIVIAIPQVYTIIPLLVWIRYAGIPEQCVMLAWRRGARPMHCTSQSLRKPV